MIVLECGSNLNLELVIKENGFTDITPEVKSLHFKLFERGGVLYVLNGLYGLEMSTDPMLVTNAKIMLIKVKLVPADPKERPLWMPRWVAPGGEETDI